MCATLSSHASGTMCEGVHVATNRTSEDYTLELISPSFRSGSKPPSYSTWTPWISLHKDKSSVLPSKYSYYLGTDKKKKHSFKAAPWWGKSCSKLSIYYASKIFRQWLIFLPCLSHIPLHLPLLSYFSPSFIHATKQITTNSIYR